MKTDQLKRILSTLLTTEIRVHNNLSSSSTYYTWKETSQPINEDGWLEVCHRIEKTLTTDEKVRYVAELFNLSAKSYTEVFASWLDKAKALCIVKGIKYDR